MLAWAVTQRGWYLSASSPALRLVVQIQHTPGERRF
jgi:hypothetical protein